MMQESRVDALIGSSPRIISIGEDLYGEWRVLVEYDLAEESIPITVSLSLSSPEVQYWCQRLGTWPCY
jgi:hypothetical protein